jgi:hypothetical protein
MRSAASMRKFCDIGKRRITDPTLSNHIFKFFEVIDHTRCCGAEMLITSSLIVILFAAATGAAAALANHETGNAEEEQREFAWFGNRRAARSSA